MTETNEQIGVTPEAEKLRKIMDRALLPYPYSKLVNAEGDGYISINCVRRDQTTFTKVNLEPDSSHTHDTFVVSETFDGNYFIEIIRGSKPKGSKDWYEEKKERVVSSSSRGEKDMDIKTVNRAIYRISELVDDFEKCGGFED